MTNVFDLQAQDFLPGMFAIGEFKAFEEALFLENLRNFHLDLRAWHGHLGMSRMDGIADAGQHISDRIVYTHDLTSIRLPGRLRHAGDFALQCQFTEADTTQAETAHVTARTTATVATVANLDRLAAAKFAVLHSFLCHKLRFLFDEGHSKQLQ
jgi:hypothetical protein